MQKLSTALIIFAGLVNFAPVGGVLSVGFMHSLYGVAFEDPVLIILMRHRAVLFGMLGCLLFAAAFHAPLRPVAYAAGLISMLSFIVIVWLIGDPNAELTRAAVFDGVASVGLLGAVLLDHRVGRRGAAV